MLKEKLIWVRWQSDNLKEEWTAEPLKHFTGVAKAKALKCMEKKECWPWSDRDRIDTLKSLGQYQHEGTKLKRINLVTPLYQHILC